MIGYYGKWGSGKTLSLISYVYKRFLKNPDLVVFSNVPMDFGLHPKRGTRLIQYNYSEIMELRPFFIYAINSDHSVLAKETIVIIDEASVVLSSRTFAQLPTFMISFLAQARHINTNFYITAQAPWEVEKIVRALTQQWVYCQRIPILGFITYSKEGISTEGRVMSRSIGFPLLNPRKYFKMYNTYHIAHYGDHQLKEGEKGFKATPKLEEFLDFAYVQPHLRIKPLKSPKKGFFDFLRKKPITLEQEVFKLRDRFVKKFIYA
jgi:hypothetical protein